LARALLADDYFWLGDDAAARAEAAEVERAIATEPNSVGYMALADTMNSMAKPAEALVALQEAARLDPRNADIYLFEQGRAYSELGRWGESISALKGFLTSRPTFFWAHLWLAIDYIELGHDDAARAEATEVLRLNPQFSPAPFFPTVGRKGKILADNERFAADLRKAGLK
jgi:adenylate cyclase